MEQPLGWELTKEGWSPDIDFDAPMPGMIAISTINGYGDLKKIWNSANADEVEDARRTFNHLVNEKKYLAFRVGEDGKQSDQIREFNAEAGKMILIPPMAGG